MQTTIKTLEQTYDVMVGALTSAGPTLLATLIVLVLGVLIARTAKSLLHRLFEVAQFEAFAARIGLSNVLSRADVSVSASAIASNFVYWLFLAFTGLAVLGTLGYANAATFGAIGAMIPNIVVATMLLILGLNVAAFLSKVIQTAAVNAEVRQARFVRNVAYYGMTTLVVLLALQQLGISAAILTNGFYIFFGSSCLAMALAFGLGTRELAAGIAQKTWEEERERARALSEASELGNKVFPVAANRKKKPRRRTSAAAAAA